MHKETTAKLPPFSEVVRSAFELRNALTSFTLEQHGLAVPSFRLHACPAPYFVLHILQEEDKGKYLEEAFPISKQ